MKTTSYSCIASKPCFLIVLLLLTVFLPLDVLGTSKSLAVIRRNDGINRSRYGYLDGFGTSGMKEIEDGDLSSLVLKHRPGKKAGPLLQHRLATLLTIAMVGSLTTMSILGDSYKIVVGITIVAYLMEAFFSSTRRYLSNMLTPMQVKTLLQHVQEAKPQLQWDLECYHYRNSRTYGSETKRGVHESRTKHVTHHATQNYIFNECTDRTQTQDLIDALDYDTDSRSPFLKITMGKLLLFHNVECYQNYLNQNALFVLREGNRDMYTDISTRLQVPGCRKKVLAVRTVIGMHDHMRPLSFWLFTLIGLTVPYRRWFSKHCDDMNLLVVKEVQ